MFRPKRNYCRPLGKLRKCLRRLQVSAFPMRFGLLLLRKQNDRQEGQNGIQVTRVRKEGNGI